MSDSTTTKNTTNNVIASGVSDFTNVTLPSVSIGEGTGTATVLTGVGTSITEGDIVASNVVADSMRGGSGMDSDVILASMTTDNGNADIAASDVVNGDNPANDPYYNYYSPTNDEFIDFITRDECGDCWLSNELLREVATHVPQPCDISSDGNRCVDALAAHCAAIFYPGRVFCSIAQVKCMLLKFSEPWGFTTHRTAKSLLCFYKKRKNKKEPVSPRRRRTPKPSPKDSIDCTFAINFSLIKKDFPKELAAIVAVDGKIPDCYFPIKITKSCYEHLCAPSAATQRFAMVKGGKTVPGADAVTQVVGLIRASGGMPNDMLRKLLVDKLPPFVNVDDQYLRNFKHRALQFILSSNDPTPSDEVINHLIESPNVAANEHISFDDSQVMIENLHAHLHGLIRNGDAMWYVQLTLENMKQDGSIYDYRLSFDTDTNRPNGLVWMTNAMVHRLNRFGTIISLDYQKRKYNMKSWPYCAPVINDGNMEIGVVAESLNVSESLNGYVFVMKSIFEMVPDFDRRQIKIIFADEFITQSLLESLGIAETCVLRCDHWHILNDVWPKYFKEPHWRNHLQGPMAAMLNARSQEGWEEAYRTAHQHIAQYPDKIEYLDRIYHNPMKFAGYTLKSIPGHLQKVGSASAEQNHSSVVAHLGRGASWSLTEQVCQLLVRQSSIAKKKSQALLTYVVGQCRNYKSDLQDHLHAKNDEDAKRILTKYAYVNLWRKSLDKSMNLEVKLNGDDTTTLRYHGTTWDSPKCITIQSGERCNCSERVAFLHQCSHEYAMDQMFVSEKYASRWIHQDLDPSIARASNVVQRVEHSQNTVLSVPPIPSIPSVPSVPSVTAYVLNDNNIEPEDDQDVFAEQEEMSAQSNQPTYHDMKQANSELLEAVQSNGNIRAYAHYFVTELTTIIRTGDEARIEETLTKKLLPNVVLKFGRHGKTATSSSQSNEAASAVLSPLKARPSQGGAINVLRKRSSTERRGAPSKKQRALPTISAPVMNQPPEADPIVRTSGTKTCGFCKRAGHTIHNCRAISKYGTLLTPELRGSLAMKIYQLGAIETEMLPDSRKSETVNESLPKMGVSCVVLNKRYLVQQNPNMITASDCMLVECTILDATANPIERFTNALFKVQAIAQYLHLNNKKTISRLVVTNRIPEQQTHKTVTHTTVMHTTVMR